MKISVIVAAFNIEDYIGNCLKSIISQTYKNLEIIVVNDGSTDKTIDIINFYAKNDKRIVVIDKPNGGLSSARNAGLDLVTGDFIGFIDGDDYINEEMYEKLYNLYKETHCDIAVCGHIRKYSNREVFTNTKKTIHYNTEEALEELIGSKSLFDYAWDKLYKKELFDNIRYPIGKIYEDVFTTYKLFLKSNKIVSVDEPLYYYIQRDGSTLRKGFNNKQFDQLDAIEEINSFFSEKNIMTYDKVLEARILNIKCRMLFDICAGNATKGTSLHENTAKKLTKDIIKKPINKLLNKNITFFSKLIILLSLPG
ncbi:hypothetical protein CN514_21660, partial [Bacillus sp. AFS001701]|uniref:glycosyltransferase family 2 protein n=1 Tax=Bacillus sp. AFS001701 TaxID=2033480 RepID=UPI000BF5971B